MTQYNKQIDRRHMLKGAAGASLVLAAGCVSTTDDDNGDDDDDGATDAGSDDEDAYEIGMVDALTGSIADFGERNQRGLGLR